MGHLNRSWKGRRLLEEAHPGRRWSCYSGSTLQKQTRSSRAQLQRRLPSLSSLSALPQRPIHRFPARTHLFSHLPHSHSSNPPGRLALTYSNILSLLLAFSILHLSDASLRSSHCFASWALPLGPSSPSPSSFLPLVVLTCCRLFFTLLFLLILISGTLHFLCYLLNLLFLKTSMLSSSSFLMSPFSLCPLLFQFSVIFLPFFSASSSFEDVVHSLPPHQGCGNSTLCSDPRKTTGMETQCMVETSSWTGPPCTDASQIIHFFNEDKRIAYSDAWPHFRVIKLQGPPKAIQRKCGFFVLLIVNLFALQTSLSLTPCPQYTQ